VELLKLSIVSINPAVAVDGSAIKLTTIIAKSEKSFISSLSKKIYVLQKTSVTKITPSQFVTSKTVNRGVLSRGVLSRGVLSRGVLSRGVLSRGVINLKKIAAFEYSHLE